MWNDLVNLLFQAYEQFSLLPLFIEIALAFIFIAIMATLAVLWSHPGKKVQWLRVSKKTGIPKPNH